MAMSIEIIRSMFKGLQTPQNHLRNVVFPRLQEKLRNGMLLREPVDSSRPYSSVIAIARRWEIDINTT